MIYVEVNEMDEIREENTPQEQPAYVPRPAWQVWLARIGAVIVIIAFGLYLYHIATGGR